MAATSLVGGEFWERVRDELMPKINSQTILKDEMVDLLTVTLKNLGDWVRTVCGELTPMIFVLDEARALIDRKAPVNPFIEWRRAISHLGKDMPLFFVLTDTTSTVGNFAPASHMDPSTHLVTQTCRLHPTKYLLPTIGVMGMYDRCGVEQVMAASQSPRVAMKVLQYVPKTFLKRGRPMYTVAFNTGKATDAYFLFVYLAEQKLTFGCRLETSEKAGLEVQYMALNAARLPLAPMEYSACERLVANHQATLVHVNESRTMLFCKYVPEAPIQEAAAVLLLPDDKFEQSLEYLHSHLRSGRFAVIENKGAFGELAVATALLRACDKLVGVHTYWKFEHSFFCPRPLDAFLCSFLGEAAFEKIRAIVPTGYVSFNKWYCVADKITQKVLFAAYQDRIALMCRPYEMGVDLVIPIVRAAEGEGAFEASEKDMIPMVIQVKNVESSISKTDAAEMMDKLASAAGPFESSLKLVIQVGKGKIARTQGEGKGIFVRAFPRGEASCVESATESPGERKSTKRTRVVVPNHDGEHVIFLETLDSVPCLTSRARQLLSEIISTKPMFSERDAEDKLYYGDEKNWRENYVRVNGTDYYSCVNSV